MAETTFVEEYRKELEATGYPFTRCRPLTTATGSPIPVGAIVDASVYYDDPRKIPVFSAVEKQGHRVTFTVGDYVATFDLRDIPETLELATEQGLFGGILVLNRSKCKTLQAWRDGDHPIKPLPAFCPRCLEFLPALGVQRLRADSGELFSGNVMIVSGKGGVLRSKRAGSGFEYVEVDYVGDPTWLIRHGAIGLPVQTVVCVDASGNKVALVPGRKREIEIVACNTASGNLFDDAFRIDTVGSTVQFSLAGL